MKYSLLGKTDIKVSNYCLGTMTFGEQTNEKDSHLQMDKAYDAGINFFDTSDTYGDGRSIAGGDGELHGISWSPSTQADWGWALFCTAITNTPIGGMTRGLALKIYYEEAPPDPRPTYNNGTAMISVKSGAVTIDLGNINIGID